MELSRLYMCPKFILAMSLPANFMDFVMLLCSVCVGSAQES